MRAKRFISSLILAIYLVASCGGMLSVILCHCPRSLHVTTHHCCDNCNHHTTGEGIKLPTNCCNHDHSTEIDLYNHEKSLYKLINPAVCALPHALQKSIDISALFISKSTYFNYRKIPLPTSDFVVTKGLRAPPVIA